MTRYALTGLIFGFFTEWLLGNGRIYDNIIKKSTMRRLSKMWGMFRGQEEGGIAVAGEGRETGEGQAKGDAVRGVGCWHEEGTARVIMASLTYAKHITTFA